MVEFRLTLLNSPKQKRFWPLEGSVKPSTVTAGDSQSNGAPTRQFNS